MTETALRRTLPEAYTIGLVGADDYWAFLEGGAGVICAAYQDGTYIEDVAETGALPGLAATRATLVAERYLLVNPTDGSGLYVWDVQENTVASYAAPAGFQVAGAGAIAGVVYWIEWPEADWDGGPVTYTSTVKLRSAGYDLATPAEVRTVVISEAFFWEWRAATPAYWFALNALAALAARRAWDVVNEETIGVFRVRLPLASGSGTYSEGNNPSPDSALALGIPEPSGGSFFGDGVSAGTLLQLEDDVDSAVLATVHWPATAEWQLETSKNPALSPDETEAVVYGLRDGSGWLLRGDVAAVAGVPRKSFAVEDHAEGSPQLMFPRSA